MPSPLQILNQFINKIPQADYPVHSRIHLLRSFSFPSASCYVKRDDELGFGISGSKIRKYRSLIPYFLNQHIKEVVIIGSAYSNHVVSMIQLLIENQIQPTLFLRGSSDSPKMGNLLLITLLAPPHSIHWFSKMEWKDVEFRAMCYAKQQKELVLVLPEGGFSDMALPGALTLPLDILNNEIEIDCEFDHVFIEAGTGLMACALILGFSWIQHPAIVHVVLLAEGEDAFLSRLKICHAMFVKHLNLEVVFPENYVLYHNQYTDHFGKTSPFLFEKISCLAKCEGILTDPIYSAKLFVESEFILKQKKLIGNILIHHSGGALTLMGFQKQLLTHLTHNGSYFD